MLGGATSYLLGYNSGKAASRRQRDLQEASHALSYRARGVEVDQVYINRLHAFLEDARSASDHNALAARQWRGVAEAREQEVASLKAKVAELQRTTAERNGLRLFMYMASRLLLAERAGKASKAEFAELRRIALEVAGMHDRGEVFEGYGNQPEKMARLRELWAALA